MAFYSEDYENYCNLKSIIEKECFDTEGTYLFFEYKMDLLDYLNVSRPQNCAVFFDTDSLNDALEISEKVSEINPRYRFNLICSETGDVEDLFYKGVSYYIKKPYSEQSVKHCVETINRFFNDQSGKMLTLKTKKGMDVIKLSDIIYVMSDKRKVVFLTENGEKSFYYKLDEIEEMLGESFLRCHQSYIVNMKKIKLFVEDGLTLNDETFVPVSRKKYYSSKKLYLSYISGGKIMENATFGS